MVCHVILILLYCNKCSTVIWEKEIWLQPGLMIGYHDSLTSHPLIANKTTTTTTNSDQEFLWLHLGLMLEYHDSLTSHPLTANKTTTKTNSDQADMTEILRFLATYDQANSISQNWNSVHKNGVFVFFGVYKFYDLTHYIFYDFHDSLFCSLLPTFYSISMTFYYPHLIHTFSDLKVRKRKRLSHDLRNPEKAKDGTNDQNYLCQYSYLVKISEKMHLKRYNLPLVSSLRMGNSERLSIKLKKYQKENARLGKGNFFKP